MDPIFDGSAKNHRRHPGRERHIKPGGVDPQKKSLHPDGRIRRKYVSRRLLALSEGDIAALTVAMRQIEVGTEGGFEAFFMLRPLLYDEWTAGTIVTPLARITVDEKNFFWKD